MNVFLHIIVWWFALIVFVVIIHWLCRKPRRELPKIEIRPDVRYVSRLEYGEEVT